MEESVKRRSSSGRAERLLQSQMHKTATDPFAVTRLGTVMQPLPGSAQEIQGVLNPAVIRSRSGELFLFARIVAKSNYSRIEKCRVICDVSGNPVSVERIAVALEPSEGYELRASGGGCEDPRVTYVPDLQMYVMTYTAFGPSGPKIATAVSEDLESWRRLGLLWFEPVDGVNFNVALNKDAVMLPDIVHDPAGRPSIAILHRPIFKGTDALDKAFQDDHRVDLERESIWISYTSVEAAKCNHALLCHFTSHRRLMSPVSPWERLKIGAGTPPVPIDDDSYLALYHGVAPSKLPDGGLVYSAGVIVLDRHEPHTMRYRSPDPILRPVPEEGVGIAPEVVFPTGIDRRDDIGEPRRFDVYYGMADFRIGVARVDVPTQVPRGGAPADLLRDASTRATS